MITRASRRGRLSGSEGVVPIAINRQLEIVTQQIVRAKIFFDIWWLCRSDITRPLIIETLNDFSEFFRFDEHAHFVSMVIHCAVVWDKGSGKVSLPAVSKLVLDLKRSCSDKKLSDDISNLAKNAARLVKLRHEAIAHRSATYDYDEAFRRAGIIPATLPGLFEGWLNVTNQLRERRGMDHAIFAELPLQHAQRVIHALGGPDLLPANPLDSLFGN